MQAENEGLIRLVDERTGPRLSASRFFVRIGPDRRLFATFDRRRRSVSARELRPRRLVGSILIMFALIGAPGIASPATATGEGAACVTDAPGMNNCARFTFTGGPSRSSFRQG
jgi:hypothetical protein